MSEKKIYEFTHIHQPNLFASEDVARGVEKKLDVLAEIHRSALASAASILESNELTAKGKQSALEELQVATVKKVKAWQNGNEHYADYASQLVRDMKPKRHSQDDIVWALEQREIRDHFRTLDPIEQESSYREAATEGNDQFLEAIEHSPLPFRFSTQSQIDKIRDERLSRQYPEQSAILKDVRMAQTQVHSALGAVAASLSKHKLEISGDALTRATAA